MFRNLLIALLFAFAVSACAGSVSINPKPVDGPPEAGEAGDPSPGGGEGAR